MWQVAVLWCYTEGVITVLLMTKERKVAAHEFKSSHQQDSEYVRTAKLHTPFPIIVYTEDDLQNR